MRYAIAHIAMSHMLTINQTQQKILTVFFLNQQDKEGKITGLTNYELGKFGIVRKTFDINRYYLISNGFVKIGEKRKVGKRVGQCYEITALGFFLLLKMNILEVMKSSEDKLKKYLPFLKNLESLGVIPNDLFKKTLVFTSNSIVLHPQNRSLSTIPRIPAFYTLKEISTIPTVKEDFKINHEEFLSVKRIMRRINERVFDDYNDMGNYLLKRFTALFIFNLLLLPYNNSILDKKIRIEKQDNMVRKFSGIVVDKTENEIRRKIADRLKLGLQSIHDLLEKDNEILNEINAIKKEIHPKKNILEKTEKILSF